MAPTLTILGRAGPYEMTAFVMAAAATATWSFYGVRQLIRPDSERAPAVKGINWKQVALLVLGLALNT